MKFCVNFDTIWCNALQCGKKIEQIFVQFANSVSHSVTWCHWHPHASNIHPSLENQILLAQYLQGCQDEQEHHRFMKLFFYISSNLPNTKKAGSGKAFVCKQHFFLSQLESRLSVTAEVKIVRYYWEDNLILLTPRALGKMQLKDSDFQGSENFQFRNKMWKYCNV